MKKISMLLTFSVLAPLFTLAVTPFFTTMLTHDGGMVATINGVAVTGLGSPSGISENPSALAVSTLSTATMRTAMNRLT